MINLRKPAVALGTTALIAAPLAILATPVSANAADREFRCSGAEVEFDVDKERGKYEVDVDVDDAQAGSKWRITLRHNGKVFHKKVYTADHEGDIDVDKFRPNTNGKDTFKLRIKQIGGAKACTRTIVRS
ncbi:MAG: hypothetical protein HZY75_12845 [Nocardioidaceae bacterium]|nr:MAG: hypothetical protein HZY75_12845 [Nocardioidaceae bacterium]